MKRTTYLLMFLVFFTACKKDWLEKKRDISVIVPTTLKDLRLLLKNELPLMIFMLPSHSLMPLLLFQNTMLWFGKKKSMKEL